MPDKNNKGFLYNFPINKSHIDRNHIYQSTSKHSSIATIILFLVILALNYYKIIPELYKPIYFFYLALAISTVYLAFKINSFNEIEKKDSPIIFISKYLFLLTLIVLAINQFLQRPFVTYLTPYIIGLSIASGFLTFYSNKDSVEKELEEEKEKEERDEARRKQDFHNKFPTLNRIPIVRNIVRWMYKEGWWYVLALLLIIILFVAIKYPYMGLDFSGLHDMKYVSYVEPAKHMIEHSSMLWNEREYIADPITLPTGIYDTWGYYQFMEHGLYFTFKLFHWNSIEFNTRLFMAFIGVLILISSYIFFKKFFDKKQTLLILLLLSITFTFQFFTYVTVLDPINILFMFISLIFLVNGIEEKNIKSLFLSGVIAGIGINIKYHALIFYLPIFLSIIYMYKKIEHSNKLAYCLIILPNFLLQTLFFRMSFRYLPRNPLLYGLIFILIVSLHFYLYFKIEKIYKLIGKLLRNNKAIILIYPSTLIASISIVTILLKIDWIYLLFKDFITDKYLIFNWSMYNTLLIRIKEWVTWPIYYLAFIFLLGLFFIKDKKVKLISYTFFATAFIYFVLTSKVLYFHEYYFHIIVISLIVLASNFYFVIKSQNNIRLKILVFVLLILLIFSLSYPIINKNLSKQTSGIKEVAEYLNDNMLDDEFFIRDVPTSISFYSNRKSFELNGDNLGVNLDLITELKKGVDSGENLDDLLKRYKIKYVVVNKKDIFDKRGFAYLFDDSLWKNDQTSFRSKIILCEEENKFCLSQENNILSEEIYKRDVSEHFILEKEIGNFYIYRID